MKINLTYDASTSAAPADFKDAVRRAADVLEKLYSNPITLNINIVWNPKGTGGASSVTDYTSGYTYDQVRNGLLANQTSAFQKAADSTLPAQDPTNGASFTLTVGEQEVLGLIPNTNPVSGTVTLSPGGYDAGTIEHELTEIMGQVAFANAPTALGPMDLFRYSAPGVRDLTTPPPNNLNTAYFSIDGGTTNLGQWNSNGTNGGDLGDWNPPNGPAPVDSFDYTGSGASPLTYVDFELISALGWNTPVPDNTVPFGVTDYVQPGQTRNGFTIANGGIQQVAAGGITNNTAVSIGGQEQVSGTANATTVNGGIETVLAGGTAAGSILNGAADTNGQTVIGREEVKGGTASNTVINSGGKEIVYEGSTDTGATINAGGSDVIFGKITLNNPTINGGILDLQGDITYGGGIAFTASGGTLLVKNDKLPATITGFAPGATIDLRTMKFDPNGTATLQANNVLRVTENGRDYLLNLNPSQNFAGFTFALGNDGNGGTNVTVTAPAPMVMASVTTFSKAPDPLTLAPDATVSGVSNATIVAAPGDTIVGGSGDTIDFSHLTAATGGAVLDDLGSDTVIGFADGVDKLAFAGETVASEAKVVADAKLVDNDAVLTFPDHSTLTFLGTAHLTTAIFA